MHSSKIVTENFRIVVQNLGIGTETFLRSIRRAQRPYHLFPRDDVRINGSHREAPNAQGGGCDVLSRASGMNFVFYQFDLSDRSVGSRMSIMFTRIGPDVICADQRIVQNEKEIFIIVSSTQNELCSRNAFSRNRPVISTCFCELNGLV
jgi:hypothetical protein